MNKRVIMIFMMLVLTFSLVGCGNKAASKQKANATTDFSVSKLKNAKPIAIAPEIIHKNVQAATKASDNLTVIGSKLDSVDDFDVKDNSGLDN